MRWSFDIVMNDFFRGDGGAFVALLMGRIVQESPLRLASAIRALLKELLLALSPQIKPLLH